MQIAHRAHAALVELVEELNERSSERGPWALTVQPGCNIATVRKCMLMIKHGPRDREFIEAVVERGNELVRPIDLARMMRSGEEWASEDHGVIFYRLVRVLNGARAIAPDETEFGRRDDVARDVQEAMTHAAELGFVLLHEGKAYTDHMHEITIPNGTGFGASRSEIKKANKPSFGTKGHQRDMVRKIKINEVKNGKETTQKKEKVCCPVFVSGDTRFLVKCIGTMRNTETPVQVEGVHLTERLVCKHVALYHPVSWPRWKQDLCTGDSKNKEQEERAELDSLQKQIDTLKQEAAELETHSKNIDNSVKKWEVVSKELVNTARSVVDERSTIVEKIKDSVRSLRDELGYLEKYNTTDRKNKFEAHEVTIQTLRADIDAVDNDDDDISKVMDLETSALSLIRDIFKVVKTKAEYNEYTKSLTSMTRLVASYVSASAPKYAIITLNDLRIKCMKLAELYDKKKEKKDKKKDKKGSFSIELPFFASVESNIEDLEGSINQTIVISTDVGPRSSIDSYKEKQAKLKEQFESEIEKINKDIETKRAEAREAEEKKNEQETKKLEEDQAETKEQAGIRDEPDLNITTQVPQDADMCVAVQVSGELFRIVHLTRDVDTQREKKAKREEEEGEEAKRAKKTKRAQKEEKAEEEEKQKYDEAGYAKKMKEDNKDGDKVRLDADYDDYRECVSAAKKYLEQTCIVNDTTESWSSAAWRLTKECREKEGPMCRAGGTSGTSGTSGTANFGELEASDRLELVLVPRNLFGHVYDKEAKPTYEGKAEISKDGIWIYEDGSGKNGCPKCAVCDTKKSEHTAKKNTSGLFVRYTKGDDDRIRGLSSRFCFHS
jgi:hypothetical protein